MNNATQRAERTAFVVSVSMYPAVWFLTCFGVLRSLESSSLTWVNLGFAGAVSFSYLAGQVVGAFWTGKIFLCADPVAIPTSLATFLIIGVVLLQAGWITASELTAIGQGAALGFILGHPVVLAVAASTDTLLKWIIRKRDTGG